MQRQAGVAVALVQNIMALYKAHSLLRTKKRIFIGTVKESKSAFVLCPVPVEIGYARLRGKLHFTPNQASNCIYAYRHMDRISKAQLSSERGPVCYHAKEFMMNTSFFLNVLPASTHALIKLHLSISPKWILHQGLIISVRGSHSVRQYNKYSVRHLNIPCMS